MTTEQTENIFRKFKTYPNDELGRMEKELDEECWSNKDIQGLFSHEGDKFNHARPVYN